MRSLTITMLTLAAAAAPAVPAAAATPQPPDCPLFVSGPAREYAITLPGGGKVIARNPYGALLARNRLFFNFGVLGTPADLAKVQKVEWARDGTTVRSDDRAPFGWTGLSSAGSRMPAGDHTIKVTVFTAAGQASTQFPVGATDCQPGITTVELPKRAGTSPARLAAFSSAEGPITAPPLDRVTFSATKNVIAALPASLRGRTVGRVEITMGANHRQTISLRAPRRGTTLLRHGKLTVVLHPGARRFLEVTGLPDRTSGVAVTLSGHGTRLVALRSARQAWDVATTMTAGRTSVTTHAGGRFV